MIRLVGDYLFTQKVREEQRATSGLAGAVASPLYAGDAAALNALLMQSAQSLEARLMVLDRYGVVQADTDRALNGAQLQKAEVRDVLLGADQAYGYYEWPSDSGRAMGLYAAPIASGDTVIGVMVVLTQAQEMYESLVAVRRQMLVWSITIALMVLVISLLVSRMVTRPIRALGVGIERIGRGDFSSRVAIRGQSEFAQLASAFNMMCERLQSLDRARNQFVSNASHELKTPLSTMKILIETLLYQEAVDPAMNKEFLGDVNKEIDRLNSIISDLLTLVHIDSDENKVTFAPVALHELMGETAARLAPLARERGIELTWAAREQPAVSGDAMKLTQVFYNLIDNGIKYTPRGGRVRVELTRAGRRAIIRVSDTGFGIPKADL
ncbi:MAG: HAMP domain-containing histidine kinase, partial [Clostridiales bacterium]|nr:HAMP domain-containing histidine kinase [Clostridiales bacterium]